MRARYRASNIKRRAQSNAETSVEPAADQVPAAIDRALNKIGRTKPRLAPVGAKNALGKDRI